MLTTMQKVLIGAGSVVAFLAIKSATASAATTASSTAASSTGTTGGGGTTPNAGDGLLVVTAQTGDAGRLNIRTNPGTNYPEVALANHGDTLIALGTTQTASDGSIWWGVKTQGGTSGWSESNYLQDLGPMTTVSATATQQSATDATGSASTQQDSASGTTAATGS